MATQEFRFDPSQILQPAQPSHLTRLDVMPLGPSLNITRGQAMARKTSNGKFYPMNRAASDGTQIFAMLAQYTLSSDPNGNVYMSSGTGSGAVNFWTPAFAYANGYTGGIFDPREITTSPLGVSPVAEIDTATPTGTVTAGDTWGISNASGVGVEVFANSTATVAAFITQMVSAWNDEADTAAIATASGTSTVLTLTAVKSGSPLNLTSTATAASSFAPNFVVATPATSGAQAEVDTFTFGGTIATGDVYTATITYGGGQTHPVTFTVGATTTAAAVDAGLIAAWNGDGAAANYATASGTGTFILTGSTIGSALNVAVTSTGAGTVSKVVTNPATGTNIADILPALPARKSSRPPGSGRSRNPSTLFLPLNGQDGIATRAGRALHAAPPAHFVHQFL